MTDRIEPEVAILFVVERSQTEVPVTKLMKLLFLADVEHQQLYGEPLTTIPWMFHRYGAFSQGVYDATASLQIQGLIEVTMQREYDQMGKRFRLAQGAAEQIAGRLSGLGPRALRALNQVLQRFGHLEVWQIKFESYQTVTMKTAKRNDRLDLAREPRRGAVQVPGLAQYVAAAPAPIVQDVGDPESSTDEDRRILSELSGLRRTANSELP